MKKHRKANSNKLDAARDVMIDTLKIEQFLEQLEPLIHYYDQDSSVLNYRTSVEIRNINFEV